jgi:hypothetical protein
MPLVHSFEEEVGAWYYFNFKTGETQWTHPLDTVFQERVAAERGNKKTKTTPKNWGK